MAHAVVAKGYGGPEVLAVVERETADLAAGRVLIEVRAAGVNPSDWKSYSGARGTDPDALPIRLGFEAAGVVVAIGPGVDDVAVGDEVIVHPAVGAYTTHLVAKATNLTPKPQSLTWEKAACLMVAGTTAVHCLTATAVGAGDAVLVHGAGGAVGSMVTQLAHARGARVVGTGSPDSHDLIARLGAHPVRYGDGLVERVRAAARHGVSAAIDTAGSDEALHSSVELVGDHRRIATIANFGLGSRLGVRLLGGGPGADPGTEVRAAARRTLVKMWEQGRLDVVVGARYHLADAARAHRAGMSGHVRGKIVLVP